MSIKEAKSIVVESEGSDLHTESLSGHIARQRSLQEPSSKTLGRPRVKVDKSRGKEKKYSNEEFEIFINQWNVGISSENIQSDEETRLHAEGKGLLKYLEHKYISRPRGVSEDMVLSSEEYFKQAGVEATVSSGSLGSFFSNLLKGPPGEGEKLIREAVVKGVVQYKINRYPEKTGNILYFDKLTTFALIELFASISSLPKNMRLFTPEHVEHVRSSIPDPEVAAKLRVPIGFDKKTEERNTSDFKSTMYKGRVRRTKK